MSNQNKPEQSDTLKTTAIFAVILALAPFREIHLWEKLKMLAAGTLVKPIDIFDLFMHGTPLLVVIILYIRRFWKARQNSASAKQ